MLGLGAADDPQPLAKRALASAHDRKRTIIERAKDATSAVWIDVARADRVVRLRR
jgi:hypothetical protein